MRGMSLFLPDNDRELRFINTHSFWSAVPYGYERNTFLHVSGVIEKIFI